MTGRELYGKRLFPRVLSYQGARRVSGSEWQVQEMSGANEASREEKDVSRVEFSGLPIAPGSSSLDPRATERFGCILLRNQYAANPSPFDVVFFRQCASCASGTRRIDERALLDWFRFQSTVRARPPRVGVYFPWEGADMISTLAHFRLGMSSLLQRIPLYLESLKLSEVLTEVGIPASVLLMMSQETWKSTGDAATYAWVPFSSVQKTPPKREADAAALEEGLPRVEERDGGAGYLRFGGSLGASVRRAPFEVVGQDLAAFEQGLTMEEAVLDMNGLGFRVWAVVPAAVLDNPSMDENHLQWKSALLTVARAVSRSQRTPILCPGVRSKGGARVPEDVLSVEPPDSAGASTSWFLL